MSNPWISFTAMLSRVHSMQLTKRLTETCIPFETKSDRCCITRQCRMPCLHYVLPERRWNFQTVSWAYLIA